MPGRSIPNIVLVDADAHIASYASEGAIEKGRKYRIRWTGHWKGWTPTSSDTVVFFSEDSIVGIGTVSETTHDGIYVSVHTVWDYGSVDRTVVYGAWKHAHWTGRVIDAPPRNLIPAIFYDTVNANLQFAAGLDALINDDTAAPAEKQAVLVTPRISISFAM